MPEEIVSVYGKEDILSQEGASLICIRITGKRELINFMMGQFEQ